jgi:Tol biopolymer transport system component
MRAFFGVTLVLLVLVITGCGEGPEPLSGRLVFLPRGTGGFDIRLPTATVRPIELTRNLPGDAFPVWSPDGSKLAFYADRNFNILDRDDNLDIYVMNADGTAMANISNNPANDAFPYWSPDGSRLAFYSERDDNGEVYTMNADGSDVQRLTDAASVDVPFGWSPDGARIGFTSGRDGNFEIYSVAAAGDELTRITESKGNDLSPVWSPDGTMIAYESDRDGNTEVYIAQSDGANPVNVTVRPLRDGMPAWSPDSNRLAFVSDREGNMDIYVMDLAFSLLSRVTPLLAMMSCLWLRTVRD